MQAVEVEPHTPVMYNLTVITAHTFFVGEHPWLVHNGSCPTSLYAFGNTSQPRPPRPSDFELISPDSSQLIPAQRPPWVHGASTFADPLQAPLTGHYYGLPAGSELPEGLDIIADGKDGLIGSPMSPTHHPIFNLVDMPYGEFLQFFADLPWQYVGKK